MSPNFHINNVAGWPTVRDTSESIKVPVLLASCRKGIQEDVLNAERTSGGFS